MEPNHERQSGVTYVPHFDVSEWNKPTRIAAGLAGLGTIIVGMRLQGLTRRAADFVGLSLMLRALINRDLTQLVGTLLSPTIRLHRAVLIAAPAAEVIAFWRQLENYPRFMSFVRKVDSDRYGNLHWEVVGPGGVPIRWRSLILSWNPTGPIAWRTAPGSPVFNSTVVRVESAGFAKSRLRVDLAYALRPGRIGHAAARLLGFDPRDHIDSDLEKMRTLIEERWNAKQAEELPLSS